MSKNCPNCGAPYDICENICPYCGTAYFDMSCVDFTDGKPLYLKIRNNDFVVTQLVIPKLGDISFNTDMAYTVDGLGNTVKSFCSQRTVTTNIEFEAIPDKNGTLFRVNAEDKDTN